MRVWQELWLVPSFKNVTTIVADLAEWSYRRTFTQKLYFGSKKLKTRWDRSRKVRKSLQALLAVYWSFSGRTLLRLHNYVYTLNHRLFFNQIRTKVYLTFTGQRLFLNVGSPNNPKPNYLSMSSGLFIKHFKNKKSFKKNKIIKYLMMKYLRKLLITASLKHVHLVINRTPVMINELLTTLTSPIVAPFVHPFTNRLYDDVQRNSRSNPFFLSVIEFKRFKSYTLMKGPRKGRLKRKIMRRIVRSNRIPD